MITGKFVENIPWVKIAILWGHAVTTPFVVLDTGFTGDLQVTPEIAKELDLKISGVIRTQIANGQIVEMPFALARAFLENQMKYVQVTISKSAPLLGINFLSKFNYKAMIDCRYRTIALQRVN